MASLFAPPELFSAFSCASDGSDPDLAKGTHLRLFAGMGASFPLAPFAVFKVASSASEPHALHVADRSGKAAGGLVLSQLGEALVTPMFGDTTTVRTVRVDLLTGRDDGIRRATLFDQNGRVVAERNRGPFLFSAPRLARFRLAGDADFVVIRSRAIDITGLAFRRQSLAPDRLLGLPVAGAHRWYVGAQSRDGAMARVAAGAPLRLNPMDQPDGPFDAVGPDDEVARVEAMLRAAELGGGLESLIARLVDDDTAPWLQVDRQRLATAGPVDHSAAVPRLGNLQMAAIDPGLARFAGFADHIDDLPDLQGGGGWDALLVVGLFAIDMARFDPERRLGIDAVADGEAVLIRAIAAGLAAQGGDRAANDLGELIASVRARGLDVRCMAAVTAPTPPWLPPRIARPGIAEHRWQNPADATPASLYRANLVFPDAPLATLAAVAAQLDGGWVPRHDSIAVGGRVPPQRSTPRIFGRQQAGFAAARAGGAGAASAQPAGLLADHDIPADAGAIRYRVSASDLFGRFGPAVEFDMVPPPRPLPPTPVIRFHVEAAAVDPAATDARSPGVVRLRLAVPMPPPGDRFAAGDRAALASAMVVPAITDAAAGSLPIVQAAIGLDAETQLVDVSAIGLVDVELALPPLLPEESRTLALTARFVDSSGASSDTATAPVKVTDRRPPLVLPTGIGLFWTSAPGPSADVELQLAWPAADGAAFRVYATDQQGLGLGDADLAEPVAGAAPSRGRVAEVGGNKVLGGAAVVRTNFRLLTQVPIVAAGGRAVLRSNLPRSLETVQFLRVVPISAEGAEAPFDACGIVPVAVPDSRRPPPPRLDGSVDPVTGVATLTVAAASFDGPGLQRDEPGLFDAGAPAGVPPQFRIRRAVGAVADPIYGREIGAGSLALNDAAAPALVFDAMISDDSGGRGLEPFVRYVYWADVRLPPERRLPAGVGAVDPPGGVTVLDPSNATSHVRPMSPPSAPRVLMRLPPDPPAIAGAITATRAADGAGAVALDIAIADAPVAHAKAIGPYRLAAWTQWPGQSITAVAVADGAPLNGSWPDFSGGAVSVTVAAPEADPPVAAADPLRLLVALVDPAGRMGPIMGIDVP